MTIAFDSLLDLLNNVDIEKEKSIFLAVRIVSGEIIAFEDFGSNNFL
jgi:hypothetical protein